MITSINEFKNSLNENANYDKLLNKTFDLFNNGELYTIIDYGNRDDMYRKYNLKMPANPMGYAITPGVHFVVKTKNETKVLSNISKKALDILNNQDETNNLTILTDLSKLQLGDTVYYKVSDNQYNKGEVVDDFGDGKFFMFKLPIKLDANYSDIHVELYPGEKPEIENKLYVKL